MAICVYCFNISAGATGNDNVGGGTGDEGVYVTNELTAVMSVVA